MWKLFCLILFSLGGQTFVKYFQRAGQGEFGFNTDEKWHLYIEMQANAKGYKHSRIKKLTKDMTLFSQTKHEKEEQGWVGLQRGLSMQKWHVWSYSVASLN